jgi:hypothetical protein
VGAGGKVVPAGDQPGAMEEKLFWMQMVQNGGITCDVLFYRVIGYENRMYRMFFR